MQQYNLGQVNGIPLDVQLDPDGWILKEVQYLNNDKITPELSNITAYPAYPNPFNPKINFQYFLPLNIGEVDPIVQIYDLKGKVVEKISLNRSRPGLNHVSWRANAPSGIYFIEMSANNFRHTQKIQLVK